MDGLLTYTMVDGHLADRIGVGLRPTMVEKGWDGFELVHGFPSSIGGVGMRCAGMGGIIGLQTFGGLCMTVKCTDRWTQSGPRACESRGAFTCITQHTINSKSSTT